MANPSKQCSSRRFAPLPGHSCHSTVWNERYKRDGELLTSDFVKSYLTCNNKVLEEFVIESVGLEQLEAWLLQKSTKLKGHSSTEVVLNMCPPTEQQRYKNPHLAATQCELAAFLSSPADPLPVLHELANTIGMALRADTVKLYAVKSGGQDLFLYVPTPDQGPDKPFDLKLAGPAGLKATVAAHVATTKKTMLVSDLIGDERFPKGIGVEGSLMHSVLAVPFVLQSEDIICVFEFLKNWDRKPFGENDLQVVNASLSWAAISLFECQTNAALRRQADLNDFLLAMSKKIFDDVLEIDVLIEKIMVSTKNLVNADRCALFLVSEEHQELYCNLLDEGNVDENGSTIFKPLASKLRFPMNKGIAGYVATNAEIVNIPDAYADARFNRDVDRKTGYTTRSILCMPIISKDSVIGVIQMVNKKSGQGVFTQADEAAFKMFAVYCALALHYSKLYLELKTRSAHHAVALEQVSYHSTSTLEEYNQFRKNPFPRKPENIDLDSFYFYGPMDHERELPHLFVQMFHNMFGEPKESGVDLNKLCRFILTMRKNYRPVAYHNWKHGFNVAHCMYCCLTRIRHRGVLTKLREMSLLVGALCHDVDHRGYNNAYFKAFNEPLAILYPQSVMEQHHYKVAVRILQQADHDFLSEMPTEDYKLFLDYMRGTIIATDLALYFPVQKEVSKIVVAGQFDLKNEHHLDYVLQLLVTSCDLSGMYKQWSIVLPLVKDLYEEFYVQGDMEKQLGVAPIPMMDRDNVDNLPQDQVGFIKFVCLPCYSTLADILPECQDMYNGCLDNQVQWQRVVEGKATSVWEPDRSLPSTAKGKRGGRADTS